MNYKDSMAPTLKLPARLLLTQGGMRNVYRHPTDESLLVKTIKPERIDAKGQFLGRRKRRYGVTCGVYRAYQREINEYLFLAYKCRFQSAYMVLSEIRGLVNTHEGLGILVERITDNAGENAPTLKHLVKSEAFAKKHLEAYNRFKQHCEDGHLIFSDLNSSNIVYTETRGDQPEFVCIDGFGDASFVALERYSSILNKRRLKRLFARMENRADVAGKMLM